MAKYYLFSDFTSRNGFSLLADEIKKDINTFNQITFIASCPDSYYINDKYVQIYLKWFDNIGINFKNTIVLDNRIDSIQMSDTIKNSSLIYLMGGTTPLQMKFIFNNKLIELIRKSDSVIMGLSAGAINMAKTSILSVTCGHNEQEVYNGIGLVDKSIEPHFLLSNFNEELRELSYKYIIYGMCDESAIIVRNNECYYYGDIYLLRDGCVETVSSL